MNNQTERKDPPTVTILLCTKQGELYLKQQLESFERQTIQDFTVIASDDGSTDSTLSILQDFQQKWSPGLCWVH